jgi:hypothetical protein
MSVLRYLVLAILGAMLVTGLGVGGGPPAAKPASVPAKLPTPDQQVAELVEAYLELPAELKLKADGDRLLERMRAVRGKLSPRSKEAIARVEASQTIRGLVQALEKYDVKALKDLVSKRKECEVLAIRLSQAVPLIEPPAGRWEYKIVSEAYVEKLGKGELAVGLGQLGEEGWELVGIGKGRYVFKRKK